MTVKLLYVLFLLEPKIKCSPIQITIKETHYCSMSTKLVRTKEIVITSLLIIIIVSVSIINSINNQQVIAQQEQQASPEEIEGEILRGQRAISIGNDTATATESSVQSLSEGSLVYESPVYGFRTQYPDGWDILIQGASNSSLSLRFNSPLENDTDNFRENIRLEVNNTSNISNTTALSNLTSTTLTSYLELYPDLKVIELSSANLANNTIPAYKLVASLTQEGLDFMQIFAIKEDKVYTISYISQNSRYSTYLPMIEQMINSFEMT
jgi:PsbP-like protein